MYLGREKERGDKDSGGGIMKMHNRNHGKRNPNVKIEFSAHPSYEQYGENNIIVPASVYVYINCGVMTGGFHTDMESAKGLQAELNKAIKLAETDQ